MGKESKKSIGKGCPIFSILLFLINTWKIINPLSSLYAGIPALKFGCVNSETPSPGEVKGLIIVVQKFQY